LPPHTPAHATTAPPPHRAASCSKSRNCKACPPRPTPARSPPPAPALPVQQAAGSGASADGDGVDGYAERLAREAQQRERPADEDGEEAEGGDTARVAADLVMQELLQKMMGGGGDGPVVKFEVVMGDGSEVAPSGLSGLLESLRSQMEGSGDDGGQEGEEDDDATNAL
jgi:hypothetical protein